MNYFLLETYDYLNFINYYELKMIYTLRDWIPFEKIDWSGFMYNAQKKNFIPKEISSRKNSFQI